MSDPILRSPRGAVAIAALAIAVLAGACGRERGPYCDYSGPTAEWPEYGGDKGGLKWSPLTQITRDNVGDLEVAWTYHHGDISDGTHGTTRTSFNATPIVADDTLYFCTGLQPRDRARPRERRREMDLRSAAEADEAAAGRIRWCVAASRTGRRRSTRAARASSRIFTARSTRS